MLIKRKIVFFEEFTSFRRHFFSTCKLTTKGQKRTAVTELVSGGFETSVAENSQTDNLVPGPSKYPILQAEKIDEMKRLKPIALIVKKSTIPQKLPILKTPILHHFQLL